MVSAAVLMGVSPVLGVAESANNTVQAASKTHIVYGDKVTATKTMNFVNNSGKKTSKKAYKNVSYKIWRVKEVNGEVYYAIQSNMKYWIPATATKGTVSYKQNGNPVTLTTNGKTVIQKTAITKKASKKAATKKATKKTSSKKSTSKKTATKKVAAKKSSSKKTPVQKAVKITTVRKAQVYDKNGKKAKTYMGSKKYTIIGKGVTVKGLGTKTIKGVKYYALQPNHYYIKASDVKTK